MDNIQIFVFLAIYLLGRFKFSVLWILLFVSLSLYCYGRGRDQANKPVTLMNERDAILQSLKENIPSWVMFPDVERAEWINSVMKTLWPRIKDYGERQLRDLQPKINKRPWMKNLKIHQVNVGEVVSCLL